MNRRRKRRIPFAAYAALIFNGALVATPFMAAHMITQAYGGNQAAFTATPEAISATRAAMDERFQHISQKDGAEPSEVWSGLVREALAERKPKIPLVRGLLLGAPAMINGEDGEALRARVKAVSNGGEEAMLQAALSYLPGDLQDQYQQVTASRVSYFTASAPASAVPGATPEADTAVGGEDDNRVATNLLGNLREHTKVAIDWANDDNTDVPVFLLSGIGLILADPEAREGASVAMSSLSVRTEAPVPFKSYLIRRIEDVVPTDQIHKLLSAELRDELRSTTQAQAVVENVFRTAIDREKLEPLLAEFRILRDIARDTSVEAATAIVSHAKDGVDLRASALVAAAGGERAVALEQFDGDNLLATARTSIPWTTPLKIQLAGVAACLLLLAFVAMTTFWKSFRRNKPRKKSAVYLMEEHPA